MNIITSLILATASWIALQDGEWTPSQKIVVHIQSDLESFVTQETAAQKKPLPTKFSEYTFQYQGREINGHKFVQINAFCQKPEADLTKALIIVADGGPCYFHVKYDPDTGKFYELSFNGVA